MSFETSPTSNGSSSNNDSNNNTSNIKSILHTSNYLTKTDISLLVNSQYHLVYKFKKNLKDALLENIKNDKSKYINSNQLELKEILYKKLITRLIEKSERYFEVLRLLLTENLCIKQDHEILLNIFSYGYIILYCELLNNSKIKRYIDQDDLELINTLNGLYNQLFILPVLSQQLNIIKDYISQIANAKTGNSTRNSKTFSVALSNDFLISSSSAFDSNPSSPIINFPNSASSFENNNEEQLKEEDNNNIYSNNTDIKNKNSNGLDRKFSTSSKSNYSHNNHNNNTNNQEQSIKPKKKSLSVSRSSSLSTTKSRSTSKHSKNNSITVNSPILNYNNIPQPTSVSNPPPSSSSTSNQHIGLTRNRSTRTRSRSTTINTSSIVSNENISVADLNTLLFKTKHNKSLLIDIRPRSDFRDNHINYENIININPINFSTKLNINLNDFLKKIDFNRNFNSNLIKNQFFLNNYNSIIFYTNDSNTKNLHILNNAKIILNEKISNDYSSLLDSNINESEITPITIYLLNGGNDSWYEWYGQNESKTYLMPLDENDDDIYEVSKGEKISEKKEDTLTNEYYPEENDDEDYENDENDENDNDVKPDFDSVTETDIIDSVKSNGYDSSLYPKSNSINVVNNKEVKPSGNRILTNGSTQSSSVYDEISSSKPSLEQNGYSDETYDILNDYRNVSGSQENNNGSASNSNNNRKNSYSSIHKPRVGSMSFGSGIPPIPPPLSNIPAIPTISSPTTPIPPPTSTIPNLESSPSRQHMQLHHNHHHHHQKQPSYSSSTSSFQQLNHLPAQGISNLNQYQQSYLTTENNALYNGSYSDMSNNLQTKQLPQIPMPPIPNRFYQDPQQQNYYQNQNQMNNNYQGGNYYPPQNQNLMNNNPLYLTTDNTYSSNMYEKSSNQQQQFIAPQITPQAQMIPINDQQPAYDIKNPIVKLYNYQNTCYINSMIQCLFNTTHFRSLYINDTYKRTLNNDFSKLSLSFAFSELFKHFVFASGREIVKPSQFLSICNKIRPDFNIPVEQQDTSQFLYFLMDRLHTEVSILDTPQNRIDFKTQNVNNDPFRDFSTNKDYLKWHKTLLKNEGVSPIGKFFQIQTETRLKCSRCGHKTYNYDHSIMLTLNFQSNSSKKSTSSSLSSSSSSSLFNSNHDDNGNGSNNAFNENGSIDPDSQTSKVIDLFASTRHSKKSKFMNFNNKTDINLHEMISNVLANEELSEALDNAWNCPNCEKLSKFVKEFKENGYSSNNPSSQTSIDEYGSGTGSSSSTNGFKYETNYNSMSNDNSYIDYNNKEKEKDKEKDKEKEKEKDKDKDKDKDKTKKSLFSRLKQISKKDATKRLSQDMENFQNDFSSFNIRTDKNSEKNSTKNNGKITEDTGDIVNSYEDEYKRYKEAKKILSKPNVSIRSTNFIKLPTVLVIYLARFDHYSRKITRNVTFPSLLSFELFREDNTVSTYKYRLTGWIDHLGTNLSSGHYTSFVNKAMNNDSSDSPDCWIYCDDDRVKQVELPRDEITDSNVYMLFYTSVSDF